MGYDLLSILELCGLGLVAFWLVGFCSLSLATHKARREFRVKGFLRPPSGTAWFRFLLLKQYQYFENPSTRLCFGISHFCMIAAMIVVAAIVVLIGSEVMLGGFSNFNYNGTTVSLPR